MPRAAIFCGARHIHNVHLQRSVFGVDRAFCMQKSAKSEKGREDDGSGAIGNFQKPVEKKEKV